MSGLVASMERTVAEVTNDRELSRKIVAAILRAHGGDRVYLPTENYRYRNDRIRELYDAGVSVKAIAKRYSLHCTTVRRIIKPSI